MAVLLPLLQGSYIFRSELISYFYSFCCCCFLVEAIFSDRDETEFGRNVPHVNLHQYTESEFCFDAIISRHFTQQSDATW